MFAVPAPALKTLLIDVSFFFYHEYSSARKNHAFSLNQVNSHLAANEKRYCTLSLSAWVGGIGTQVRERTFGTLLIWCG